MRSRCSAVGSARFVAAGRTGAALPYRGKPWRG